MLAGDFLKFFKKNYPGFLPPEKCRFQYPPFQIVTSTGPVEFPEGPSSNANLGPDRIGRFKVQNSGRPRILSV